MKTILKLSVGIVLSLGFLSQSALAGSSFYACTYSTNFQNISAVATYVQNLKNDRSAGYTYEIQSIFYKSDGEFNQLPGYYVVFCKTKVKS
ncbi:MAG: hypothetical protein HY559_03855 [Gammaproteobacteria bacterium]|nr:hypothetical protein [Gammaproteobacteria bacterium]